MILGPGRGGAHRLTTFTAANGVTTTLDYDSAGRIIRSYTAQGYSDYTYEDGTDWLVRETWHAATSLNVFDPSASLRASLVRNRCTAADVAAWSWPLLAATSST